MMKTLLWLLHLFNDEFVFGELHLPILKKKKLTLYSNLLIYMEMRPVSQNFVTMLR